MVCCPISLLITMALVLAGLANAVRIVSPQDRQVCNVLARYLVAQGTNRRMCVTVLNVNSYS